jgi:hypothetical protein
MLAQPVELVEMEMLAVSVVPTALGVLLPAAPQAVAVVRVEQEMFLLAALELRQIFLEAPFFMVPAVPATMVVLVRRQVAQQRKALMQLPIVVVEVHTEKQVDQEQSSSDMELLLDIHI